MRRALALALLALIPVLPAVLPGTETYLDNPSHLVEVRELTEILAEEGWFSGWGTRANAGMAVNQVNAPLVWLVVALLGQVVGALPVYLGGILLSNVAFTLGAWRFFRRFLEADAAWLAAALAALAPQDLYGFAGAAGGMWPHRLANGLLLYGLGATGPTPPGRIGLWLALVLLCHTYSGMDAAGIVGIAILLEASRREWREAARYAGGAVIGALLSAPFWVPLLWSGVRPDFAGEIRFWNLADHLAELFLPFSPVRLNHPTSYVYLGGPLNFAWSVLLLAGLYGAWTARDALRERLKPLFAPPLLAGPIFLVVLGVIVMAVVPYTLTEVFGPNPWRHLALVRAVLCGLAGAGLVALGYGVRSALAGLLVAIALVGAYAGVREMRLPLDPKVAAQHASLRATWRGLADAGVKGRVYHQNTSFREGGPIALRWSEIGALLAWETDLSVVGTWYTISAVASEPHMRSANEGLMGDEPERWFREPRAFFARAEAFDLGAFVAVEPRLAAFLGKRPEARKVAEHGPFSAWVIEGGGLGAFECPAPLACADAREGRAWAEVTLTGPSEARTLGVRQTWHPWWTATLDGAPIATDREKGTGRLVLALPALDGAPKTLAVRWVDPTRWTAWLTLAGALLAAAAWRERRAGSALERAA